MKPEIMTLPENKCALDFIAELGDRAEDAWIMLHINVVEYLKDASDAYKYIITSNVGRILRITFNATESYPETIVEIDVGTNNPLWYNVYRIEATDIKFRNQPLTPKEIIFIKYET